MDMNEYALEVLARDRLAELRATRERASWAIPTAVASRPLRAAVGDALIRLGRRLQGVRHAVGDVERKTLTRRRRTA
jgi:hypothetical protein